MEPRPLPETDSEDLAALVGSTSQRLFYGLLYRRRRDNPPTMVELRAFAAQALGEDQSQTGRRVRELRRYFDVVAERQDGEHRYILRGWAKHPAADGAPISLRRRAEVLAPQRCAMCCKIPLEHNITLVVDHRIPQSWGGSNDVDNPQPLCEDCNPGKRDSFHSFEAHAQEIRKATSYDEPQRRIGALLAAFKGEWVRGDLIGIVASAKEYQEDWQPRLRDLRFFGWKIEHQNRYNEEARVRAHYRATVVTKLPENIPAAIRAEEARRRPARSASTLED